MNVIENVVVLTPDFKYYLDKDCLTIKANGWTGDNYRDLTYQQMYRLSNLIMQLVITKGKDLVNKCSYIKSPVSEARMAVRIDKVRSDEPYYDIRLPYESISKVVQDLDFIIRKVKTYDNGDVLPIIAFPDFNSTQTSNKQLTSFIKRLEALARYNDTHKKWEYLNEKILLSSERFDLFLDEYARRGLYKGSSNEINFWRSCKFDIKNLVSLKEMRYFIWYLAHPTLSMLPPTDNE